MSVFTQLFSIFAALFVSVNTLTSCSIPNLENITAEGYVAEMLNCLPDDENYVVSPLSLKMAMMLAANGAEGETKQEILDAFGIESLDEYNESANALIEKFNSNDDVHIANSIWFNKSAAGWDDADFSEDYKKIIEAKYNGIANTVTFDNSIESVNDWIETETNGKIQNMLGEESRDYLAALVNTIYMDATWEKKFKGYGTYSDEFKNIDGSKTETDFMHQMDYFDYYKHGDEQMVRLPYTNGLSVYVVLGNYDTYINGKDDMKYVEVQLTIPKFESEYYMNCNEILNAMGIQKSFDLNSAEFTPMMSGLDNSVFCIDQAMQKTMIDVDEDGTEASAATVATVVLGALADEPEPKVFTANKPFSYYIVDDATGEMLFAGRYVKVGE